MTDDRYARGLAKLAEISGSAGGVIILGLADLAPDLGRYIVEFDFGGIYSRSAVDH